MVKVSIIIPVYGVEKYIEKCARSVFEQTYSNLEIVFVNDCTPDNSISIIQHLLLDYPHRISQVKILNQDRNRGVSAARRRGLDMISGDYCIQFDSDDYVGPTMIEELVNVALKEEADVVISDYNLVAKTSITHIHINPVLDHIECMKLFFRGILHASLWNKLIRVRLYSDHQIQFIEGLNMREDLSVMYRLLYYAHKIAYIPKPFYSYVLREGSVSSGIMNSNQQVNAQDLIEHVNKFFVQEHIQDQDLMDAFLQFKAKIKSTILLFGDSNALREELYKDIHVRHYSAHPNMPFILKAIGMLSCIGFQPLVSGYRLCFHCLFGIRKKIRK